MRIGPNEVEPTEEDFFFNDNSSAFHGYGIYSPFEFFSLVGEYDAPELVEGVSSALSNLPTNETVSTFSNCSLDINENEDFNLSFFPNPAHEYLQVTLNENHGFHQLQIFDLAGELVLNNTSSSGTTHQIDISMLDNGAYFGQLSSDNQTESFQFIKQ